MTSVLGLVLISMSACLMPKSVPQGLGATPEGHPVEVEHQQRWQRKVDKLPFREAHLHTRRTLHGTVGGGLEGGPVVDSLRVGRSRVSRVLAHRGGASADLGGANKTVGRSNARGRPVDKLRGGMSRLPYRYVGMPLSKPAFAPVTVEVFVDFFCPFSAKCTKTMIQLASQPNISVRMIPYPQPWHWEGGIIATCFNIIAKNGSPEEAVKYYETLMGSYQDFVSEGKKGSIESVKNMCFKLTKGIKEMKEEVFMQEFEDHNSPGVVRMLKNQIKYGRVNAIHETPSFMVNGLVVDASSSWDLEKWLDYLKPLLDDAKASA